MNEKWGPVLFLGLGLLALFLFTRRGAARSAQACAGSCGTPARYWVAERVSPGEASEPVSSNVLYQNEEKTHIEYNSDGLPTEIVIHRTITRG